MDLLSFGLWAMALLVLGTIARFLKAIVGQLVEMNRYLKNLSADRDQGRR